jgi:uncharacterized repeat protein (TIGR03806 family)
MLRVCFHGLGLVAVLAVAVGARGQSLVRTPATSLRISAIPPTIGYTTTRAFPGLAFTLPVAIVAPPDDTRRLFVVEKPGRIWVIPDITAAAPTRMLFLDLTSRVTTSSDANDERGLLALAFHPRYATNGQFFVWYSLTTTTSAGGGLHERLARFQVSASDPNQADAGSEQPLITQRDEAGNHNGGQVVFGPDGYLYLSIGDEGGANDQFENSQRIDRNFFSCVLRIDVDRRPASLTPNAHPAVHANTYAIPPDNPFVGATRFNGERVEPQAVRTEFGVTGLRNPWRMSFDPATGQLWCGDVGQGAREEIDVIIRGGNYGWNYREGAIPGPRANPPAGTSFVAPIWDYPNPAQGQAVTGGIVYRGNRYSALVGHYVFADFGSGRIWSLRPDGENPVPPENVQLLATDAGISSFGTDPSNGDILLCDLTEGVIKRLVASDSTTGTQLPATLSLTGAFSNVATLTPAAGVIAYEPNVSSWSDYAQTRRWFALPDATGTFGFSDDGPWSLPMGVIWIQHFDLELTRGDPSTARRVETRLLVKTATGVHGVTYRWNNAQTDATLVPDEGVDQTFNVVENGVTRPQTWHFPNRAACLTCHTAAGGFALSFNTRQLNREHVFPGGTANILSALAQAGYLNIAALPSTAALPTLAAADDATKSLELRARSYLDVNCAHCHQPGGTALGSWDARASTPLTVAQIVNGPLIDNGGNPANRVALPGDPLHSRIVQRMATRGNGQMPPIGSTERDLAGESLLNQWIIGLAAPTVTLPPSRLVNLAARAPVGDAASAMIAGFVIAPGSNRTVLIRGLGPALAVSPFNLAGVLTDPMLTLFGPNSATRIAATNDNWVGTDASTFAAAGAFPLVTGSRDAALVADLPSGSYTVQLTGNGSSAGIGLVEIYDADTSSGAVSSRLINAAVRAQVGSGANLLIPGLVISAGAPKTVLVRAIGPGIASAPFNVPNALAEPVLSLFKGSQRLLTNAAWNSAPNATAIRDTARAVGAFPLAEASRDSALLVTLPPAAYTLHISGANNTTGVVLVEIYDVP